jgi:hypothetical protein
VYFWGERMPMVMCVFGREERWGRKAVPSSPAPRRRILFGDMVKLSCEFFVDGFCEWGVVNQCA